MKTSEKLVARLRTREQLRLKAYPDQGGVWTIGYGTTRYPDGRFVKAGDVCTKEQAEAWLRHDVATAEGIVTRAITRALTQAQLDACVMFAYNTGTMGRKLAGLLNAGELDAVPAAMLEWKYVTDKKTGVKFVSNGLVNRRKEEIRIFQGEAAA